MGHEVLRVSTPPRWRLGPALAERSEIRVAIGPYARRSQPSAAGDNEVGDVDERIGAVRRSPGVPVGGHSGSSVVAPANPAE